MSETDKSAEAPKTTEQPKVFEFPITFGRSPNFRAVHANGMWFSSDTEGNIHIMFYNDHFPAPKKVVMLLNEKGHVVGEAEAKRETFPGTVREIEVDVILSQAIVGELHRLLGDNLAAIKKGREQ